MQDELVVLGAAYRRWRRRLLYAMTVVPIVMADGDRLSNFLDVVRLMVTNVDRK